MHQESKKDMSRTKEEALKAGVTPAETKHHMKRRKPWHNYRSKGIYMLTLVVEGRLPLLGRLVIPDGKTTGEVELTALGRAIRDEEIRKIPAVYPMVEVWQLCIMPDHLHMIVRVKEDMPEGKTLGNVVRGFKVGCSRAWWRLSPAVAPAIAPAVAPGGKTPGVAAPIPAVSPAGLPASIPAASPAGFPAGLPAGKAPLLFESGYNDQILLREGQLVNWKRYLDDNPRRLAIKRLHPEFFTTLNHVDIDEWHCQLVGNGFLLNIPQKVAVIVHGAYDDQTFAQLRQQWLACGEAGGVLVSAAIAPREKEVLTEAIKRGYRIIHVMENGFPPLYKPVGEAFDDCAAGLLLQLSPWDYHMNKRRISREQCLMLNRLVERIVELP